MSLLTPDSGLLFWMIVSQGLSLSSFPNTDFLSSSRQWNNGKPTSTTLLKRARQAEWTACQYPAEGARILAEAKEKQNAILKEAFAEKEQIIDEAHRKAAAETRLQVEEAARRIREEKEKAIREVRSEIADLSIAIAEKVMKEKISRDKEQQQIIDRLLDEVSFCKFVTYGYRNNLFPVCESPFLLSEGERDWKRGYTMI